MKQNDSLYVGIFILLITHNSSSLPLLACPSLTPSVFQFLTYLLAHSIIQEYNRVSFYYLFCPIAMKVLKQNICFSFELYFAHAVFTLNFSNFI